MGVEEEEEEARRQKQAKLQTHGGRIKNVLQNKNQGTCLLLLLQATAQQGADCKNKYNITMLTMLEQEKTKSQSQKCREEKN